MDLDLNNLLREWPHEPGQIQVRKIMGSEGSEKLQLRIDLGLIQMEMSGRPDGARPHSFESLLDYQKHRAAESAGQGRPFSLNGEECAELQQEGIQYYHRYVSLYQIKEFEAVVRDTERNLDLFDFVEEFAESDDLAESFEQFRPYVLMMRTRAEASICLEKGDFKSAGELIAAGRAEIIEVYAKDRDPAAGENSTEVQFLDSWKEEALGARPLSKIEQMTREMEHAIQSEAYERAAELRDAIAELHARQAL